MFMPLESVEFCLMYFSMNKNHLLFETSLDTTEFNLSCEMLEITEHNTFDLTKTFKYLGFISHYHDLILGNILL